MQLSNRNNILVNPPYNFSQEAHTISTTLNYAISKLNNNKLEKGCKILHLVKEMLVEMNRQYSTHYFQEECKGISYAELASANYNYSWNERNIKRLEWCLNNLNSVNPNRPFILEVLKGKKDIP